MKALQIDNNTIKTTEELSNIYNKLSNNKNIYLDVSTNLFLDTKASPESITISKGEEVIDDVYRCDKNRYNDYNTIMDKARNNTLKNGNVTAAFHYGVSNDYIELLDIISSIENNDNKYFMTIFTYDLENANTASYEVEI